MVYLFVDRVISLFTHFFCMGGESIGESSIMVLAAWGLLLCYLIIMNMFRLTYGVVVHGTHSVCFIILPVSMDIYC